MGVSMSEPRQSGSCPALLTVREGKDEEDRTSELLFLQKRGFKGKSVVIKKKKKK